MASESGRLRYLRNTRVLIVLLIIIAFLVITSYTVESEVSARGLTTRIFYAARYCTTPSGSLAKIVTFSITAGMWSSSSLHTTASQVTFSLSVDGTNVGSFNARDVSWDPGGGITYALTFSNPAISPTSLPSTSSLVLSVTAQVTAGLVTSQVTTSDSSVQSFGATSC